MANICIIPARIGSKRIPKKNIKLFNGKPIISHVIKAAISSNIFDEIMVSTDSSEIAEIAKKYGAKVPFLRSKGNANDFAILADVLFEVLNVYKKEGKIFENICCFLPTAALITPNKIIEAYNSHINGNYSSVVPVLRFSYPIQRAFYQVDGLIKLKEEQHIKSRSQDLEIFYHDSGQFYWINTNDFLLQKKIFTNNTGFIELKEYEAQDVDTPEDWVMLELKDKIKN